MGPSRRGEARRRLGRRLLLLALVSLGAFQVATAGSADGVTVEPAETPSGFAWKPSSVTSTPGGTVAFRNPGNLVPHGVHWTGGPEKPSCSGVPVDEFGTSWSGTCTFSQTGTYTFVCTVHPEEMKGTITVAGGETSPAPGPAPGSPAPAPAEGPLVEALRLPRSQHGTVVRGLLAVSAAAAGGRLTVVLEAKRASLGQGTTGRVRVGKLTRLIANSGQMRFAVALKASAQRALRQRGHLPLILKAAVTPPSDTATTMTRRVELHD
ncbi:MAG TPA: plastocyanin/azurin family copper-binding protein [Solirubrobacterales bacterium]|nr:plastocyanin/azurin family copper-binding protein [Solirubrobacterales bacterium]